LVYVTFNQPVSKIEDNIVSFPNFEPHKFLTFTKMEWISSSEAVVEYTIHPDVPADHPSVDIAISLVTNTFGRAYPGWRFSGKFSVKSTPPIVTDVTVKSPQCHGYANGELYLAVKGGMEPFTYAWTKDNEPISVTGPNATNLAAGKYDVVVKGSDHCIATYSATLTNSEAMELIAEVKRHLEKRMDGEIVLTASGGIPPYTYYMNNVNEGAKTGYTQLDEGVYHFKVEDDRSCAAFASAEVKNYQIPTIFTPNDDGYNDVFMEGQMVEIFDRNGTLVFKGYNGWDGRYRGQYVRPAVYYYMVIFTDGFRKKGTVQVYKP